MRMGIGLAGATAALVLAGCATAPPPPTDIFANGGRVQGAALDRRVAEAVKSPLGSNKNPVRVNMPTGQRAYLDRLRCSDGKAPTYSRNGNLGEGVYGSIVDAYNVVCASGEPKQSTIIMDMYHPQHNEKAAPPGFTIVG